MTPAPPAPPAPPVPVSPLSGLPLEEGGGATAFWPVMIGLTCVGMVVLAALLLLVCAWAKPKHLTVGKVAPSPRAGGARPSTPTTATTPRGSTEFSVAKPSTFLRRSSPPFARDRTVLGSGRRLPQQNLNERSSSWNHGASTDSASAPPQFRFRSPPGTAGGLRKQQQECGGSSSGTLRGSSTKAAQHGHPPPTHPPTHSLPPWQCPQPWQCPSSVPAPPRPGRAQAALGSSTLPGRATGCSATTSA